MKRFTTRLIFKRDRALRFLIAALGAVAVAQAANWEIGPIGQSSSGSCSSMQIDTFGNAHVAYVTDDGILRYSFWDHNLKKWFDTPLDKATGFTTLILDSKQRAHISYPQYGLLKHTYWDGSAWRPETIPVASKETTFYTSIALDAHDRPSISYYENISGGGEQVLRMRVVARDANVWTLTTVDPQRGSGKFNSIAIDSKGGTHIAYANVQYETASLRYGIWNGTKWQTEILEGAGKPGTYRQAVMLILDKNDTPHVTYSDALDQIVKYATRVDGKWRFEAVDSIGRVAYPDRNGIALDEQGNPYISYYDAANGVLKVAHRIGQRWVAEEVDAGFAGFTSSLQIHDGMIWVTYSGGPGRPLQFARRPIAAESAVASDDLAHGPAAGKPAHER